VNQSCCVVMTSQRSNNKKNACGGAKRRRQRNYRGQSARRSNGTLRAIENNQPMNEPLRINELFTIHLGSRRLPPRPRIVHLQQWHLDIVDIQIPSRSCLIQLQ